MLATHFQTLDDLLAHHRAWWQFRPFHQTDYPWSEPALVAWLDALPEGRLWALDEQPLALAEALRPWLPGGADLLACVAQIPAAPALSTPCDARLGRGVPGRKWAQIVAFAGQLGGRSGSVLEWCAGKGHLGRMLASQGLGPVHSCEWQPALCAEGQSLADRQRLPQHFVVTDVMALAPETLPACELSVALHACGDLHRQLLQLWAAGAGRHLAVAPCCYHLQAGANYQAMSRRGQGSVLALSRADLNQAMQATVTGGARGQRLRDREFLWRMAFDEWQRQLDPSPAYLPLPNVPKSLLTGSLADFMAWAAARKGLPAPPNSALEDCAARGARRARRVRRMELVAKLFRRPLELWLVLDRACYLEEQGAQVSVHTFCDYRVTPRNYLIQAERGGA